MSIDYQSKINKYHSCRCGLTCVDNRMELWTQEYPPNWIWAEGKKWPKWCVKLYEGETWWPVKQHIFLLPVQGFGSLTNVHLSPSLGGLPGGSSFTCSSTVCSKRSGKRVVKCTNALEFIYQFHWEMCPLQSHTLRIWWWWWLPGTLCPELHSPGQNGNHEVEYQSIAVWLPLTDGWHRYIYGDFYKMYCSNF